MSRPLTEQSHSIFLSVRIRNVLDHIAANRDTGPTLKHASRRIGVSKFYFERIFKREIGVPYKKYLLVHRYFWIAAKLRSHPGKIKITDVCLDCGIGDLSNFLRMFKRILGCSPKKFKEGGIAPSQCCLSKNSLIYRLSGESRLIRCQFGRACYLGRARLARKMATSRQDF